MQKQNNIFILSGQRYHAVQQFSILVRVVLAVLILNFWNNFISAQTTFTPSNSIIIGNCYQKISLQPGNTYNLLSEGLFITTTNPGTGFDLEYIYAQGYDINGNWLSYAFPTLWGNADSMLTRWIQDTSFQNNIFANNIVRVLNNENLPEIQLFGQRSEVKKIELYLIFKLGGTQTNQFIYYEPIEINLISDEDSSLTILTNNNCTSFNNFSFNLNNQLDGFCGDIRSKIKRDTNNISTGSQIDSVSYSIGSTIDLSFWGDSCEIVNVIPYGDGPEPIPYRCKDVEIEFELFPCPDAPVWCFQSGPKIIRRTQRVCCSCDIRILNND